MNPKSAGDLELSETAIFCVVLSTTSNMSEEAVRHLEGRLKALEERLKRVEVRYVDGAASTVIVER